MAYRPSAIEPFWQKMWEQKGTFRSVEDPQKPKFYALDMFPYPSAAGLHVGHPLGYTATDIVSRSKRMQGFSVLHPMGFDAFGLPAEQHAIATGVHPGIVTDECSQNFRRQLKSLGFSYDWSREISTCDPSYYKWTQWIFALLIEKGLAYQAEMPVNWCPALKTVLANDEVIDGKSERGGHPVFRKPMRQWVLKITAYAERLLEGLDGLNWNESTKEIQRNWIGKSVGAKVRFAIKGHASAIEVFTTRPDTLYGVSYLVLAPEHPLVPAITQPECQAEVKAYQDKTSKKSDFDRTEMNKDKTGTRTGALAIHPLTGQELPVFISDYVLANYGTGAVMAVPGHDERDHAFAKVFGMPIVQVVAPTEGDTSVQEKPYCDEGVAVHSPVINGLATAQAKETITRILEEKGCGEKSITYKFRDWIFSRQRFWGEPIPVLKDASGNLVRTLRDDELPLTLPEVVNYEPNDEGLSPLENVRSWICRTEPDGSSVFVESHTMPGAAGSSWYFLRYCDPHNTQSFADFDKMKYWMPVDLYVGGQEHAVGHLLYSRFWTKVLFDAGLCPVDEPFQKLIHQGMVCRNGQKMSKSKGNGVDPDTVVAQYGADALRTYEMFMGPFTQSKDWEDNNLAGVARFLARLERHYVNEAGESLLNDTPPTDEDLKVLHKTIQKVTQDIENLSFNTSVAHFMTFINHVYISGCRNRGVCGEFLKLVSPWMPHLAEELWRNCILGPQANPETDAHYRFISLEPWPVFDPARVVENTATIGVQVNGKHRGEITLSLDATQDHAMDAARQVGPVAAALEGKALKKVVYVPGRILNIVAG